MKRTTIVVAGAVLAVSLATGATAWAKHRHGGMEKKAAFMVSYVASELQLDDSQKQALTSLKDQVIAARSGVRDEMKSIRNQAKTLVEADSFDQAAALDLVTARTAAINQMAPEVIASLGLFLDSLNSEQKAQVMEFINDIAVDATVTDPLSQRAGTRACWHAVSNNTTFTAMLKVLLIDDDEKLADLLGEYCARYDIELGACTTPSAALDSLRNTRPDAVILDVMLPEMDGFEVCKTIRQFSEVPIIMLTARGDLTDRVVGLELGADDYLGKPFEPRELVARINSITRRRQAPATPESAMLLEYGGLLIDRGLREVSVNGDAVELTTMEYQLLLLLAESPGQDFSRDDILNRLKGTETELFSRSVDILVSRLRSKLKPLTPIKTVYGSGYAFVGRSS